MLEGEYIKIKKGYFVKIFLMIFFIAIGYFLNSLTTGRFLGPSGKFVQSKFVENCKTFCELANVEYAYVKDDHCFCNQRQVLYDRARNETITITQTINSGIIKDIQREPGLTQEAQRIIQQQQRS